MSKGRRLLVAGVSHHTAPLHLRERLALTPEKVQLLQNLLGKDEASSSRHLLLGTCNRVELYLETEAETELEGLIEILAQTLGLEPGELRPMLYIEEGKATVEHLIRVCAGLDSQILGENEIFGQVKEAYAVASRQKTAGPILHRLFQRSFKIAKQMRTQTGINSGQVSLGNVAAELARRIFGNLSVARVIVLGSGAVGENVAKALVSRGAVCVAVSSRTQANAERLTREIHALAIPFDAWPERIAHCDIVLTSTSAPGTLITPEIVRKAMARRPHRPLFLVDLAMPRDIDPEVAELPNVFLYNLDDLAALSEENLAERKSAVTACEQILREKAPALWSRLGLPELAGLMPEKMKSALTERAEKTQPSDRASV